MKYVSYLPAEQKLWGWVVLSSEKPSDPFWYRHKHAYCWWSRVGKTISTKKHSYSIHKLTMLERKMSSKGYIKIDEPALTEMWPDFLKHMENRMIFEMLSDA